MANQQQHTASWVGAPAPSAPSASPGEGEIPTGLPVSNGPGGQMVAVQQQQPQMMGNQQQQFVYTQQQQPVYTVQQQQQVVYQVGAGCSSCGATPVTACMQCGVGLCQRHRRFWNGQVCCPPCSGENIKSSRVFFLLLPGLIIMGSSSGSHYSC